MKEQIRKLSTNPLLRNFASVGFIQGLSLLLPLLTIPYLLTTVGADGFALINVALAVTTYFVVFTDYGFNLMGTRLVALHQHDKDKLNQIFSNMLYAQLLLTLIGIALFLAIVFLVPAYRENGLFFIYTFGIVIGSTLLPTWFFQGREKFNQLHLIMLGYRGVYTASIFLMINSNDDLIRVPMLNSATSILGGLAGLSWIMARYKLRFTAWSWGRIFGFLKEGWNLFRSALSVISMQQLPIIILAFFVNATLVGYYAFAEKILLLFRVVVQLLGTILYPRVIKASQQSFNLLQQLLRKVQGYGSILFAAVAVLLFFTPNLLQEFLPQYYNPSLHGLLRIWSLLPLLLFLKVTSEQVLLAYDYTRQYARVMISGAIVNLLILGTLGWFWGTSGIALAVFLTEVFLIFALVGQGRKMASKNS